MAYESNVSQSSYSPGKLSINCNDKSILKWCFGPEHFTLDWKALCDLQYENIAEKPDEAMAFYIQQPIKNAQHAKIKATKVTFLFQKKLKGIDSVSF